MRVRKLSSPNGDRLQSIARLIWDAVGELSPPYGDSTLCTSGAEWHNWFSPPYGDSTTEYMDGDRKIAFSPPYGDGTNYSAGQTSLDGFSPPYGDGTNMEVQNYEKR